MTHHTNTPTHNNNVSADKPSTVETIKEKASAVVGKLTGKHHTDSAHGHDHHADKDHHHGDNTGTHTTGTHTTGATGAHTGPVGTHTGAAHAGAIPGAAPTATHSTGAGITAGGNVVPPVPTHGVAGTHDTHGVAGTHDTHGGTHVPHSTGLAGTAATQPLNHQHNQHQGAMSTTNAATADVRHDIAKVADTAYHHPEKVDQAVHDASVNLVGHQPSNQTANAATADVIANDPNKADAFAKDVTSRLVGQPGDPNNLEAAHIKPTM
ncbi:hypothetical protein BG015_004637 [Linnemannia schmuckeri]|uniref:Uncharacterized protein n=1 Tax=Linnemannia schmuckeri TaxID=64567 RepID=A0A9P5R9N2_9FUNG|nr:hypothetical protein BG015_004637 [Linnemannia schmuckeri]